MEVFSAYCAQFFMPLWRKYQNIGTGYKESRIPRSETVTESQTGASSVCFMYPEGGEGSLMRYNSLSICKKSLPLKRFFQRKILW